MTEGIAVRRPPYDAVLGAALDAMPDFKKRTLTAEAIVERREAELAESNPDAMLAGLERRDVWIPTADGAEILVSVISRPGAGAGNPGVVQFHSGGTVMGNRFSELSFWLRWVMDHHAVVVTVEYRLAPEHPDPTPVQDCFTALRWTAEHADELGIDPARLIVSGASAGGGLAAGVALLARDFDGPSLAGQLLICPMLDDRDNTVSTEQLAEGGIWDRGSNITGWTALLGERRGSEVVSPYAAPARMVDLSGLPPTFIDCGSAELFRDEDVAYASALWRDGCEAELHVWPGGFHGFDFVAPEAPVSIAAVRARENWFRRIVGTPA